MTTPSCIEAGCNEPARGAGRCGRHYFAWRNAGEPEAPAPTARTCSVDGCDRPLRARDMCLAHYKRWAHHGDAMAHIPIGQQGLTIAHMGVQRQQAQKAPPAPPRVKTVPADHERPVANPQTKTHKGNLIPPPIPTGLDGILTTTSCPKHGETALEPWPKPADLPSWLEAVRRLNTALHHYATGCTEQLAVEVQPAAGAGVPVVRRTA